MAQQGTNSGIAGSVADLSARSREIFREVVEAYLQTGSPIGSRTLSRRSPLNLSAASIRNVMADLEDAGLLAAPHTSAGRLPTEHGLRLFVDGLLEVGGIDGDERKQIESQLGGQGHEVDRDLEARLTEATAMLSGLSHCAGLVVTPPQVMTPHDEPLRHVEFVHLGAGQALVVLVTESGRVDNKIIEIPMGMPPAILQQATNFVSARLSGKSLPAARRLIEDEINTRQAELDALAAKVIDAGLADWGGAAPSAGRPAGTLIVRGQANLIDESLAEQDLERVRQLFADLESKQAMMELLGLAQAGDGVRIFIGSENKLFSMTGSSVIVAPYQDRNENIVGMVGVIGPTRLNYGRIIPMVDYTAQLIGKLID